MNKRTTEYTDGFYRVLAGVAMLTPTLLVCAAGTQPDGARGSLIVDGLSALVAIVATALVVRAAYSWRLKSAVHKRAGERPERQGTDYSTGSYA